MNNSNIKLKAAVISNGSSKSKSIINSYINSINHINNIENNHLYKIIDFCENLESNGLINKLKMVYPMNSQIEELNKIPIVFKY